jgi:hypothetical protein
MVEVTDTFSLHHENDHLGNIGCVVGNAFYVFGDDRQTECPGDRMGVFDHERNQLAKQLVVQNVDLVVIVTYLERQLDVLTNKGVETVAQHALRDGCHARQVDERLELRLGDELDGALADVLGNVTRPLQVRRNLERRRNQPQVPADERKRLRLSGSLLNLTKVFIKGVKSVFCFSLLSLGKSEKGSKKFFNG